MWKKFGIDTCPLLAALLQTLRSISSVSDITKDIPIMCVREIWTRDFSNFLTCERGLYGHIRSDLC